MKEGQKFRFKIAVIGDSKVGKSSLMKKFTKGGFKKDYDKTLGAQFSIFDSEMEGYKIRLLFWDIAGSEEFLSFRQLSFKNSKAAITVFSLEENEQGDRSFKHVPDWYKDVLKYCGDIPIYVFANKVDLIDENILDETKIKKMVEENNFHGYYLTSAITGHNILKAFNAISKNLHDKFKKY